MFSVDYRTKNPLYIDNSGRPTAPLTLYQKHNNEIHKYRIDNMLIDTGAVLTSLNKKVADMNNYPIIKRREPILMGFNDFGRAIRSLVKAGKTDIEAKSYLAQFAGRSKELLDSLHNDFGITDIGLVCDTRKVSYAVMHGFKIENVIIATPSDGDVIVAEVIGMNILEKFAEGIDTAGNTIFLNDYSSALSRINPSFMCGDVSVYTDLQ